MVAERRFFRRVPATPDDQHRIKDAGDVDLWIIEYRSDGRRFSHRGGVTTEFEGDGRLAHQPIGDRCCFVSHRISVIEDRVARGIWVELTYVQAFPGDAPVSAREDVW